jgi:hypothetical protein
VGLPGWFPTLSRFLCAIKTHLLGSPGERLPLLRSIYSGGTWWGWTSQWAGGHWAGDTEVKTPPSRSQEGPQKCFRRTQTETERGFQEASLLSKPATTQWTQVQRLSPENKGGFPYIPFRIGYRNDRGCIFVPFIITYYFIGCFNLWGKVPLLWSPCNILQLWFFFVSL